MTKLKWSEIWPKKHIFGCENGKVFETENVPSLYSWGMWVLDWIEFSIYSKFTYFYKIAYIYLATDLKIHVAIMISD